jgi:hypothetical protein
MTQPAPLLVFPPEATPDERRALLEKISREHNLPPVTSWEGWDASFGAVEPMSPEEQASFLALLAQNRKE